MLRQSGETLAGRIAYIDMAPLSALEVDDARGSRERLWLRGGFPDSYLAASDEDSLALRRDFIRTYLERDVALFGPRVPATTLERMWTMLAHRQGTMLNASVLARALEVSAQSVTRYIDLLADLLLLRRLPPFRANVGKRLVKSPKVYVRDSGLVHALLGIASLEQLAGHPVVGESWEGHVIETLVSVLPPRRDAVLLQDERRRRDRPPDRAQRRHALGDRDQALAVRPGRARLPPRLRGSETGACVRRARWRRRLPDVGEPRGGQRAGARGRAASAFLIGRSRRRVCGGRSPPLQVTTAINLLILDADRFRG